MANKTKKIVPTRSGADVSRTARPDVADMRADESTFIARVDKPLLNNKEEWVRRSHAAGMDMRDIVAGSGLKVSAIYRLCEIEPLNDKSRYDALVEFRNNLIMKQR